MNTDGGNDAYFISSTGLSTPLTSATVELRFSGTNHGGEETFISYNTANGDELSININNFTNPGELELDFGITGGVKSTAINYETLLLDGQVHTLSVTWSNAGTWSVYVDGVMRDSGTGLAVGETLSTAGRFVFGQEQDSLGGGFDPAQKFQGTFYDARIFSSVRTAAQITSSYQSTLPYNTTGMIANWRFDDYSTSGVVTESVSGNNLTLGHATGTGFTNSNPSLTFAVHENSVAGTVVGTVNGYDIDREARITQLLAADPTLVYSAENGKFYRAQPHNLDWAAAQTLAGTQLLGGIGGELLTIESATEQQIAQAISARIADNAWIGGSDAAVEGEWRWTGGSTPNSLFHHGAANGYAPDAAYTNWAVGQPDDNANQDFALFDYLTGKWSDTGAQSHSLLIQWNADAVLDATNAITYSINSQTVAGAFAINASTGQITVADATKINFEANPTHTLTVRVTDGSGATFDKAFTVSLSDIQTEPASTAPASQSVNEDTNLVFSSGNGNAITVTDNNSGLEPATASHPVRTHRHTDSFADDRTDDHRGQQRQWLDGHQWN